ncbi:MAG: helix-turn-helix domain-containing protein [Syntrophaceticus sp.]|jgi:transposase|nr:helix-turn-helix domain-containing protein [Syntrophaceticus sp.]
MSDNLTIVRAVYSGLSQRQAAATYHVSRNTVSLLLRHARNQGWLTLEDLAQLDNVDCTRFAGHLERIYN